MSKDQTSHDVSASFPHLQADQNPSAFAGGEQPSLSTHESVQAAAVEQGNGSPSGPPGAAIATPSTSAALQVGGLGLATSVASGGMPAVADDIDLIEKEWVEKAKEIVSKTRTDPFAQNQEMNKVKAEYLKKRYNKDVKIVEI